MPLFSARMKKIQSKMKAVECSQHFSHCKSMGNFQAPRAANSAVHGPIRLIVELNPDFMVVLVTYKNEDDSIKNEELECSQHYTVIFQTTRGS